MISEVFKHSQIIDAVKAGDPNKVGVRRINAVFHDLLSLRKDSFSGFAEGESVIYNINDYDLGFGTVLVDPAVARFKLTASTYQGEMSGGSSTGLGTAEKSG